MGHVDHGKTTLLDYLRKSSVAASEAGGITQHIGAFSVPVARSAQSPIQRITFLDTPGHAAFSRIRERGANATDIVVLVVAADDGVMAQTIESIQFAQAANVPLVVAINKSDRCGPERAVKVKEELLKHGVVCEDFGGDTQAVAVSGLTGLGMDNLMECLLLQGELLELRADPSAPVEGVIIESRIKTGLGECATMLVQNGTLRVGTLLVAEDAPGKARLLTDHSGGALAEAGPSTPVEVAGWRSLPRVGATVMEVSGEAEGLEIVQSFLQRREEIERTHRERIIRERAILHDRMWQAKLQERTGSATGPLRNTLTYEEFETTSPSQGDPPPILRLVVKTDVIGSSEAVASLLQAIKCSRAKIEIVSSAPGHVTETDISLAKTIRAQIITFGLRTPKPMLRRAESEGVVLAEFNIIYRLAEYVTEQLLAMLPVRFAEQPLGMATILQLFTLDNGETVLGCRVDEGTIIRSREQLHNTDLHLVRLKRGQTDLCVGRIATMRHLKKEISSAGKGLECGIILDGCAAVSLLPGDTLHCLERKVLKPTLD